MKLKIDVRETKLIDLIKSSGEIKAKNYDISIETLHLGDIVICDDDENNVIIIERKSISDLASSIVDGRYNEQSYRLNNSIIHNHNIIYLVEGDIQRYRPYSNVNKNAIYSSIFTLNYYKGFSVLRSMNLMETSDIIIRIFDKIIREKKKVGYYSKMSLTEEHLDAEKTDKGDKVEYVDVCKYEKKANITPENIHIIMLCQIPYISSASAKAILNIYNYKTLVAEIDTIDLTTIKISTSEGKERKLSKRVIENLKKYL
jgi:ERCC4-type nuclease